MENIQEFRKGLEEYKKQIMEAPFTDIRKLVQKYGTDINDDWVFMYLSAAVIREHENLWGDNKYEDELSPINNKIDDILKQHGLEYVEEFLPDERPTEIDALLKDYDDLWDRTLSNLFCNYGLTAFGEFYKEDKEEFLERFEKIRSDTNYIKLSLSEIVIEFENESRMCADIQAFNAATILIASALEGLMLDIARKDSTILNKFIDQNRTRKKKIELMSLTLSQLISLFKEAGVYPFDNNNEEEISINEIMLEIANLVRNLIHPGRKIKAKYINTTENEYIFLNTVYAHIKSFYYK